MESSKNGFLLPLIGIALSYFLAGTVGFSVDDSHSIILTCIVM